MWFYISYLMLFLVYGKQWNGDLIDAMSIKSLTLYKH